MAAHLGTVDQNGVVRFQSDDINACREFLRSRGLECEGVRGWLGNGQIGLIDRHAGQWHAAAFRSEFADSLNVS